MVALRSRLDSAADMHGRWSSDVYSRYIFDAEVTEKRGDSMKRVRRQVVNSASTSIVTISAISPMSSATTNSSSTFLTSHLLRGTSKLSDSSLAATTQWPSTTMPYITEWLTPTNATPAKIENYATPVTTTKVQSTQSTSNLHKLQARVLLLQAF